MNPQGSNNRKADHSKEALLPTRAAENAKNPEKGIVDIDFSENKGSRAALGDDIVVKSLAAESPRMGVVVDFGKDSADFLSRSSEINSKPLDHFAGELSDRFGVSKEKIMADPELQRAYLEWRDFQLNRGKRLREKARFDEVSHSFNLKIVGYVPEKDEDIKEFVGDYVRSERRRNYASKVINKLDSEGSSPEQRKSAHYWMAAHKILNDKYLRKEITKNQYLAESDKLDENLAKSSGDKELQTEWADYKTDFHDAKDDGAKVAITPETTSEKPVEVISEVKSVLGAVDSQSCRLDFHGDGSASAFVGPEKYPMEISVFKDENNGKYFCYVSDKYSDNGLVRVESTSLAETLDGRYLDSYVSSKIALVADGSDSPNKIPDGMITKLCTGLLGNPKSRGYKLEGENKDVLDAMIQVLEQPSSKFLSYYKKIEALNVFFEKKDNRDDVRRRLLAGEKFTLDDLLRG